MLVGGGVRTKVKVVRLKGMMSSIKKLPKAAESRGVWEHAPQENSHFHALRMPFRAIFKAI